MNVEFPLFVFEKDDRSMLLIEKPDRLLHHLETIDIENDEYVFWDSTGAGVCVSVTHDAIDQITPCVRSMSLSDAFQAYSQSLSLRVSLQGPPIEVWRRIQSQLPKRRPFWTRLFAK
jgi:hypothetical protein